MASLYRGLGMSHFVTCCMTIPMAGTATSLYRRSHALVYKIELKSVWPLSCAIKGIPHIYECLQEAQGALSPSDRVSAVLDEARLGWKLD